MPKGTATSSRRRVETQQPLLAPIARGPAGRHADASTLDGKPYGEFPVVALEDVPLAGIFGRGWDSLRLFFK